MYKYPRPPHKKHTYIRSSSSSSSKFLSHVETNQIFLLSFLQHPTQSHRHQKSLPSRQVGLLRVQPPPSLLLRQIPRRPRHRVAPQSQTRRQPPSRHPPAPSRSRLPHLPTPARRLYSRIAPRFPSRPQQHLLRSRNQGGLRSTVGPPWVAGGKRGRFERACFNGRWGRS